jgi:hypothetical protein
MSSLCKDVYEIGLAMCRCDLIRREYEFIN